MSPTILDWKKGSDEENKEVEVENGRKEEKIRYLTIIIAATVQKQDLPQYLRFPVYTDMNRV